MEKEEQVQEEKKLSNREQYLARMKARRGDVDYEDEEARYGAFLQDDDDRESALTKHRESDAKLSGMFKKDPRFAALLNDAIEGGDVSADGNTRGLAWIVDFPFCWVKGARGVW